MLDKYYYTNCYSDEVKGSKAVAYKLEAKILALPPAGKRPKFKSDPQIPAKYQTHSKDYTHSGYDRGHILSNASMNATKQAQASTFLMSNITPQNPQINRIVWKKVEERERALAKLKGSVEVLNIIIYPKKPLYIKNNIQIPQSYIKIIKWKDSEECYQVPNHQVEDTKLESYHTHCTSLP